MSFAYTILAPPLHQTANAAIKWFLDNWGINKSAVKVEQSVHTDLELRPTFNAQTRDSHILCIEVSENAYANHLNAFVVGCLQLGLPVKLFVAVTKGTRDPNLSHNLKVAKLAGVGLIEVDDSSGVVMQDAVSLSLMAVRAIKVGEFPKKYRHSLSHAEQTFRNGTPEKACALVYDEIENLFRKIALRTNAKGWWKNTGSLNIQKDAWATLIDNWSKGLDRASCPCPKLTPAFAAQMIGVTPYRNDTGHKPKNLKELIKRDQQLRTRFESAVDLFRDLVEAAKPLKI